jgi:hypothetical protein
VVDSLDKKWKLNKFQIAERERANQQEAEARAYSERERETKRAFSGVGLVSKEKDKEAYEPNLQNVKVQTHAWLQKAAVPRAPTRARQQGRSR